MRLDRQTGIERGGIALIEEALHLVRSAPPSCLVAYYLGSIPFVMTLLYFWADMSYSADAYLHCAPGAHRGHGPVRPHVPGNEIQGNRSIRAEVCYGTE